MQRQLGGAVLDVLKDAGVCDDQTIGAHLADGVDIFVQLVDVFVVGKQVQGQIGAPPMGVTEGYTLDHLLQRELGFGAQGHIRGAEIDRISPV